MILNQLPQLTVLFSKGISLSFELFNTNHYKNQTFPFYQPTAKRNCEIALVDSSYDGETQCKKIVNC